MMNGCRRLFIQIQPFAWKVACSFGYYSFCTWLYRVSAEECVALADETLQKEIQQTYPDMWQRIATRKAYLKETLKLDLPSEVLPMSI